MKVHTAERVTLLRRRKTTSSTKDNGYSILALQEELFQKPTLLCCGGRYITTHSPGGGKQCNGFAKTGHGLLEAPEYLDGSEPYDIVSVMYPGLQENIGADVLRYNEAVASGETPEPPYSAFALHFARDHLFPLVEEAGKKLPLAEAKKRLRNVQVLAHSYGGAFIQQVGNALHERMVELGYTPMEIREACAQALVVTGGNMGTVMGHRAPFTMLSFVHRDDGNIQGAYRPDNTLNEMMGRMLCRMPDMRGWNEALQRPAKELLIMPVTCMREAHPIRDRHSLTLDRQSRYHIAYLSLPENPDPRIDRFRPAAIATQMERSDAWGHFVWGEGKNPPSAGAEARVNYSVTDKSGHQPETHYYFGTGRNGMVPRLLVSAVLRNGMNNAVRNADPERAMFEPLPPMQEMLSMPKHLAYVQRDSLEYQRGAQLAAGAGWMRYALLLKENAALLEHRR